LGADWFQMLTKKSDRRLCWGSQSGTPNEKRPGEPGRLTGSLVDVATRSRTLRVDLGVVALGVPLVDDVVDDLDVALGVERELAEHGIPFAGLDGFHDLLR